MGPWRLKRLYARTIRELGLSEPFDLFQFCGALEARPDGRPITLVPFVYSKGSRGPSGVLIGGPTTDWVFYRADTSAFHQMVIIFHELYHRACRHQPAYRSTSGAGTVLPQVAYLPEQEWEAEMLASLTLARASSRPALPTTDPAPEDRALIQRLEATLGGGRRLAA